MAPPKQPRHPRQTNAGSTDRGRYNTASRLANTGTTPTINNGEADDSASATGPVSTQSSVLNNPAAPRLFPHLGESATYGAKRPHSDQQDDDDGEADDSVDEHDGESSAPPRRSRDTVRQNIIDKDKGYFRKQQAQKDKRDKKVAAEAAVNSEVDGDEIVVAAGRSQKQSASKQTKALATTDGDEEGTQIGPIPANRESATKRGKGKAPARIEDDKTMESDEETTMAAAPAKKAPASKKGASEAPTSSTAGPSIQAGNLVKGIQASEKPEQKRSHHKQAKPKYDSAPSDSEPEPGHDTLRKLRNTVDRHAFWCPFVRFNKRLENMHRRMKKVEGMLDTKSSSGGDENGKAKTSKDLGARKAQSTAGESKESGEGDDSKNDKEKEGAEDEEREPKEKDEENEEPEDGDLGHHEHDDKPDDDQSNNNNDDADADPTEDDSGKKSSKAKAPSKSRMSTTKKTAANAHSASKKSAALSSDITEAAYNMADDEDGTESTRAELAVLNALDPTESDDSDASSVSHISAGVKHGDALLDKPYRNSLQTLEQGREAKKKDSGNRSGRKCPRAASHVSDRSLLPNESVDDEEEISLTEVAFDKSMEAHEREAEKTKKRKAAVEEPGSKPAEKKRRTSRQSGLIQN